MQMAMCVDDCIHLPVVLNHVGCHFGAKRLVIGFNSRHYIQHRTNANGTEGFNSSPTQLI